MREEAAEDICSRDGVMTFQDAKEFIARNYMVELKGAPFDQDDPKLVMSAGACETCPLRTGNDRVLYPDGRADVCTNPGCYREKVAAHGKQAVEQAKAAGKPVLDEKPEKLFSNYRGDKCELRYDTRFVDLAEK